MISAGVEGRLAYMTYSDSWSRNPPKQPPEVFLRPAPKLLPPPNTRFTQEPNTIFLPYRSYNGVPATTTTYPNGTRIAPSRPISKYPSPPPTAIPVNLTQTKDEIKEETLSPYSPYRLFQHNPQYTSFPYSFGQQPYLLTAPPFPPTPLSPQNIFSPGTPTASSTATFLSPPATFSPPTSVVKPSSTSILRGEKRTSPIVSNSVPHSPLPQSPNFKVPSGKEGSLKHRLLIRPEDAGGPLDLQKPPEGRKRLTATISPPRSPKRHLNNNTVPANFQKGQLIQLANGEFKKIEEMRTEDFIQSAEKSPALRLSESQVLKIEEGKEGHVTITLKYDEGRAKVEVDSTAEHPYFVIGLGWASCHPDRTLQVYGLKVHRLKVADYLVSLTPRETPPSNVSRNTTIMTTATTTAMSSRQYSSNATSTVTSNSTITSKLAPPLNHRPLSHSPPKTIRSPDYPAVPQHFYPPAQSQMAPLPLDCDSRKRRWSAPDAVDEEEMARKARIE